MAFLDTIPWWGRAIFTIGLFCICGVIAFSWIGISNWLKEKIEHLRYVYKYKHRFDKPPLAKCYCRDCENWHPHAPAATEGKCWGHAYMAHTADNWFCWDAEPRDKERRTE